MKDQLHLNDLWRVKKARTVIRHFQGELDRFGVLS